MQRIQSETLAVVLDVSRESCARQWTEISALDGKLTNLLQAGAILAGVAGLSGAATSDSILVGAFSFAALLYFALLVGFVIAGMRTRLWDPVFDPQKVWDSQWDQDADAAMHALVQRAAEAYTANLPLLLRKGGSSQMVGRLSRRRGALRRP